MNDPTETIAGLYAAFDAQDADDALILGQLADAYSDAGWYDHEAATREILAAGLRPGRYGWWRSWRCPGEYPAAEGWIKDQMGKRLPAIEVHQFDVDRWYHAVGPRSSHFRRLIVALAPTAIEAVQ